MLLWRAPTATGRLRPGPRGSGGRCVTPGQDVLDRLGLLLYRRELLCKALDGVAEQPRLGDGGVEEACLVDVLHLCQVEPENAFPRDRAVTFVARRSVSCAQVHRDHSLHLGNARVPPGSPTIEGSEDGGDGRVASGHERGHPRLRQLLMHLRGKKAPEQNAVVSPSPDPWGSTRRRGSYCYPQISQSARRWFSARARETSEGWRQRVPIL